MAAAGPARASHHESAHESRHKSRRRDNVLTRERFWGAENRWRRFGEPTPAGESLAEDGAPDYGLFGPGSVVWEVLLHPATIVFEGVGQGTMQLLYKPIAAGIRDRDPVSRKAREGTLTFFDSFERFQRNSGMHAPMWLGDTATARRMAKHLHQIHQRVAGEVIDTGEPELGGYAASEPRDATWAALTELHPVLRIYEAFAFRGGRLPHRLSDADRDRFVAEAAPYCRLVGAREDDIPTSTAELAALYERDADLFRHSDTLTIDPQTGDDYIAVIVAAMRKNFHPSQIRAIVALLALHVVWQYPVMGALSGKARKSAGYGPVRDALARASAKAALPLIWVMQQPPVERRVMRLMWGPDGVTLIASARALHAQAKAGRLRPAPASGLGSTVRAAEPAGV